MDHLSRKKDLKATPEIDRIVYRLHRYGLSDKEIAMVVNTTEKAVKCRISETGKLLDESMK